MGTETDAERIARQLGELLGAFREDTAAREAQWEKERTETEARHQAEVARVQKNSDSTRALHERSVQASERLAIAMERIAQSFGVPTARDPAQPRAAQDSDTPEPPR